jgi:hypothetical protein
LLIALVFANSTYQFLCTAIYFVFKNLDLLRTQKHYVTAVDSDEVKIAMNIKYSEAKVCILKNLLKLPSERHSQNLAFNDLFVKKISITL